METLLHAALSNAVLVAVLAPVVALFGRISRRPALTHSLWLVVLLKLLTPPLWPVTLSWTAHAEAGSTTTESVISESTLPAEPVDAVAHDGRIEAGSSGTPQEVAVPPARTAEQVSPVPRTREGPATANPWVPHEPSDPVVTAVSFSLPWQVWVVSAWLLGSVLWLALAGYRVYQFQRLLRLTKPAPEILQHRAHRLARRLRLARCPGVCVVAAPVSPLLWALVGEPRLLVPVSLLERLSEEQWDTLLAHELAHLRRRDHWVRRLELAVLALYWWHPVVWWARRELREAEEQCCDAWVVWALPEAAPVYAATLVEAVTYLSGARSALPLAASGIGQVRFLRRRLIMIMRGTTPRALSAAGSLAVLGLAAVLLPFYPTWAQSEQAGQRAGDEERPAASARTAGGFGGIAPGAAVSTSVEASDEAGSGAIEAGGATMSRTVGHSRTGETVDDLKDEVELLRVQLELRRAERGEVVARLRQARTALERIQRLVSSGAATQDQVEQPRTEVDVQEARLAGKDAQIREAELRLKQAERRLARMQRTSDPARSPSRSGDRPGGSAAPPSFPKGPSAMTGGGPGGMPRMPGAAMGPAMVGGPASGFSLGGGGFSGMGPGGGTASSLEHRLTEVEKKLQNLIEEMRALRKEQRPGKSEAAKP